MSANLDEIRELIETRLEMAEEQDFFGGLGLETSASSKEIQTAYFNIAKILHPDRLSKMKLEPGELDNGRIAFEFVTKAFNTLSDTLKRQDVIRSQEEGEPNPHAQPDGRVRLKGEEARIFSHKGNKLLQMKAWDRAEQQFRKALVHNAKDPELMIRVGWAVFNNPEKAESNRLDEARRFWESALSLESENPRALYYLSLFYKVTGDTRKQRQYLQRALDSDSDYVDAKREWRLMEMRRKSSRKSSFIEKIFPSLAKKGK